MDLFVNTVEQVCVLISISFVMARTHLTVRTRAASHSLGRWLASFAFFLLMAMTEEVVASRHVQMSARIVSACAAGLLCGPVVGLCVGLGTALMRQLLGLTPPLAFGLILGGGGLVGGIIHDFLPRWHLRSVTGFVLGTSISTLRYAVTSLLSGLVAAPGPPLSFGREAMTAAVNGLGVAVILKVFEQVGELERSSRAAAMAEVRSLQARMNPHFLFNALNTIAAMASPCPEKIPTAVARLGRFLRGSLEQHDRPTVTLREELGIATAYLEIEALRFGDRLRLEIDVPGSLLDAQVPPFSVQPLAENAVRHGIQSLPEGGLVRIAAVRVEAMIVVTVEDSGVGLSDEACERISSAAEPEAHALSLLKRRLAGLYGRDQGLDVRRSRGGGTTAEFRIPCTFVGGGQRS